METSFNQKTWMGASKSFPREYKFTKGNLIYFVYNLDQKKKKALESFIFSQFLKLFHGRRLVIWKTVK